MSDFVNDDGDEGVFGALGVGAIFFGPRSVEADHGILHAEDGAVDRDRDRVGVIEGELGIHIESVDDGVGGILAPKWLCFIRVEGHGPDGFLIGGEFMTNGVPDEFLR